MWRKTIARLRGAALRSELRGRRARRRGDNEPSWVRIAGDLDVSTAAQLADALDPEVGRGGDLTLDLAGVKFVDSSGLQLLMQAARKLEGRGRLILVAPQPRVKLLFGYILLDRRGNVSIVDEEEGEPPA